MRNIHVLLFLCSSYFAHAQSNFLFPLGLNQNTFYNTDSLLSGLVIDTFPNGQTKHIGFYVDGKPNGMIYNYFDHGKISSKGRMYMGKKEGHWLEYFYSNGKIKKDVFYYPNESGFSYELNYYQTGNLWHATFFTHDRYKHYEFYLKENGDTQFVHRAVDSLNAIYTYSEFHAPGKPNVIGYFQYTVGKKWENIGTWVWYTEKGAVIRKRVYSDAPYGKD